MPAGPFAGRGILITRPARQAAGFAQKVAALGGTPVIFPAIAILPPADPSALARVHAALATYDIAIFVSANAVEYGAPDLAAMACAHRGRRPGSGNGGSARGGRHCRRAHSGDDVRQRGTARASRARRRARQARADPARRRWAGAPGRCAAGARRHRRLRRVLSTLETADRGVAGLAEAFRDRRIDAVTITSSEGLDNLWALADDAMRAAWRAVPDVRPAPADRRARARPRPCPLSKPAGGDAGLIAGLLEWSAAQPQKKS